METRAHVSVEVPRQQAMDGCITVRETTTDYSLSLTKRSSSLLNGLPFYMVVISVPQRLQTVNGESPVATGVKLLPYTLIAAVGSIIATTAAGPGKVPPIYVMWFFSALATIGTGLMTTLPSSEAIDKSMYGYLTLAGLGIGGTWGLVILLVGYVVEERDVGKYPVIVFRL